MCASPFCLFSFKCLTRHLVTGGGTTEDHTPTVIRRGKVPRNWPFLFPSLDTHSRFLSHPEPFDARTKETWIRGYPEGMCLSGWSIVFMQRESNLPCVPFWFPLNSTTSPFSRFFCLLSIHLPLFFPLGFLPRLALLSSCTRYPCRRPRPACQPGFKYSQLVCQCIPNYMRSGWN